MTCHHGTVDGQVCDKCVREKRVPPGPYMILRKSVYKVKRDIKAGEKITYVLLGDGRLISDDIEGVGE